MRNCRDKEFNTKIVKRILSLIKQRGETTYTLEKNKILSCSTISLWKGRCSAPSAEALYKLATYFNVSADYLLCLSDEPTKLKMVNDMTITNGE